MKLREFWIVPDLPEGGDFISSKPIGKRSCFYGKQIHVREVLPELDAAYTKCEKALENVNKWFNGLSSHQDELLNQGLYQACKNWSKATDSEYWPENVQSFDFNEIKSALAILKKARGE